MKKNHGAINNTIIDDKEIWTIPPNIIAKLNPKTNSAHNISNTFGYLGRVNFPNIQKRVQNKSN